MSTSLIYRFKSREDMLEFVKNRFENRERLGWTELTIRYLGGCYEVKVVKPTGRATILMHDECRVGE